MVVASVEENVTDSQREVVSSQTGVSDKRMTVSMMSRVSSFL